MASGGSHRDSGCLSPERRRLSDRLKTNSGISGYNIESIKRDINKGMITSPNKDLMLDQ